MASTQKIPIPTDSYDHSSCDVATLSSIKTLITCFDTTMDSFHESIDKLSNRLDMLTERTTQIQNRLDDSMRHNEHQDGEGEERNSNSNGNGNNKIAQVTYPALYEHATQLKNIKSTLYRHASAITIAKQRANDAVKLLLLQEVNQNDDDSDQDEHDNIETGKNANDGESSTSTSDEKEKETTTAKPSDEWLDRPSAFEERSNCNTAVQINTVPPLLYKNSVKTLQKQFQSPKEMEMGEEQIKQEICKEETAYYQKRLGEEQEDSTILNSISSTNTIVDSMNLQQSLTLDYYDDNMSVMSEFTKGGIHTNTFHLGAGGDNHTLASSTYSTVSYGTTSASRRRRQRKIMAMAAAASSPSSNDTMQENDLDTSLRLRQEAFSGSMPYVCDLLHDTYGLIDGKYGHVYPPIDNVHDLLIHDGRQSGELAYEHHDKGMQPLHQNQQQQVQKEMKIDATKHAKTNIDTMKRVEDSSSSLEKKMGGLQLVEEGDEE